MARVKFENPRWNMLKLKNLWFRKKHLIWYFLDSILVYIHQNSSIHAGLLQFFHLPGCWHPKNPMDAIVGDDHYSCLDFEDFSCLKKRNFCKNRICENQGLEGKNEGLEDDVFFLKMIFQVPW